MTADTLDAARERLRPHVERARSFTGWLDLPSPRPLGPDKPWDYTQRARELLAANDSDSPSLSMKRGPASGVLDLGTGGGERFADLLATAPHTRAVATEEWPANVRVAADSLRAYDAAVVHCSALQLPFADTSFDVILSRHESIMPSEIARTLRPGGAFLTQQTWRYMEELHYYISRTADFGDHFNGYGSGLNAAGLAIVDARQHVLPHAFEGLEDLVYLLCIAAWEIPDFDPLGRDLKPLLALERDLTTSDGLVLTCGHYIIEAHKPA